MINANVRIIKREQSRFHTHTKTSSHTKALCGMCGHNGHCQKQSAFMTECSEYQFPIIFRDPSGLDDSFNTMRMGGAWARRLRVDDVVALINKEGERIGQARVTSVLLLPKDEALATHGERNHLMLLRDWRGRQESVAQQMGKILRNNYGNLVYSNNDQISVIYLKRI